MTASEDRETSPSTQVRDDGISPKPRRFGGSVSPHVSELAALCTVLHCPRRFVILMSIARMYTEGSKVNTASNPAGPLYSKEVRRARVTCVLFLLFFLPQLTPRCARASETWAPLPSSIPRQRQRMLRGVGGAFCGARANEEQAGMLGRRHALSARSTRARSRVSQNSLKKLAACVVCIEEARRGHDLSSPCPAAPCSLRLFGPCSMYSPLPSRVTVAPRRLTLRGRGVRSSA